jgi:hypothetical protein
MQERLGSESDVWSDESIYAIDPHSTRRLLVSGHWCHSISPTAREELVAYTGMSLSNWGDTNGVCVTHQMVRQAQFALIEPSRFEIPEHDTRCVAYSKSIELKPERYL